MKVIRKLILTTLIFFSTIANTAPPVTQNFLVITDIHLNIRSKHQMQFTPKAHKVCNDLDLPTFKKLIATTKQNIQAGKISLPEFIIILGDIHSHKRYKGDITATESVVFKTLHKEFPHIPTFYVYGNNDSPQRNYGKFSKKKKSPFNIAIQKGNWKNGFLTTGVFCNHNTFPCIANQNTINGYYSAMLAPNLRLIALNSVLFSIQNKHTKDANFELRWFASQLEAAHKHQQQVLVAMHIPPRKNVYNNESFWRNFELRKFLHLLDKYQDTVIGVLASHTHQDEIKVLNTSRKQIGVYLTPALSTSYANAPALKEFNLINTNKKWSIADNMTYKFSLEESQIKLSKLYSFKKLYCRNPQTDISQCLQYVTADKVKRYMSAGNPRHVAHMRAPQNLIINRHEYA